MKPKEVQQFFDSSVRKLKKFYGTEASNVYVRAVSLTDGHMEKAVSLCHSNFDWDRLAMCSFLSFNAKRIMDYFWLFELSEDVLKASVLNTACHEMAHHLVTYREIRNIRNEWCHEGISTQVIMLKLHLSYIHQGNNAHGTEWQEIMEEMGADPTSGIRRSWKPVFKLPAIFNGRL